MPGNNFIWAADESGSLGECILFGLVSLDKDDLPKVFAYNMKYSGVLLPSKQYEFPRTLYVKSLLLDPDFRFSFLILPVRAQLVLLQEILDIDASRLYAIRGSLTTAHDNGNTAEIEPIISRLNAYIGKRYFADAFEVSSSSMACRRLL